MKLENLVVRFLEHMQRIKKHEIEVDNEQDPEVKEAQKAHLYTEVGKVKDEYTESLRGTPEGEYLANIVRKYTDSK